MKRRHVSNEMTLSGLALIVMLSLLVTECNGPTQSNIPTYVRALVFEQSPFAVPIALRLPPEDNRSLYNQLRNSPAYGSSGIRPVYVQTGGMSSISPSLAWFLVRQGLAEVQEATLRYGKDRETHRFLFYKDGLRQYVINSSQPNQDFEVVAGRRKLASIDYKNEYEATAPMGGPKIKFYALTFSYLIQSVFPGLPSVGLTFQGKAKVYLDPDDGQWKLEHFEMNDSGAAMFTDYIERQYAAAPLFEKSFRSSGSPQPAPLIDAGEHIPTPPSQHFNDYAGVVSSAKRGELDSELERLEMATSEQVVVAIYPERNSSLALDQFAKQTMKAWRIGEDGAVLFVFLKDHQLYLEVGDGLSQRIPDRLAFGITQEIAPYFKRGDFDGGMSAGVSAVANAVRTPPAEP